MRPFVQDKKGNEVSLYGCRDDSSKKQLQGQRAAGQGTHKHLPRPKGASAAAINFAAQVSDRIRSANRRTDTLLDRE